MDINAKLFKMMKLIVVGTTLICSGASMAATYDLELGDYNSASPYMRDLIQSALEQDGHTVSVTVLDKSYKIRRIIKQVAQGQLALLWTGRGRKFDEKSQLLTVNIGLTKGLKAKQVLFISKGAQSDYDNVKNLDQFRALSKKGVFGSGWAALDFWKSNKLDFITIDGSPKSITKMSVKGGRGFDYFSRGVLMAPKILSQNPGLELEKNLIIEFDDDFIVYLNKGEKQLQKDLQQALAKAVDGGLMDKLLRKHFVSTFDVSKLNYDNRIKISLEK